LYRKCLASFFVLFLLFIPVIELVYFYILANYLHMCVEIRNSVLFVFIQMYYKSNISSMFELLSLLLLYPAYQQTKH